MSADQGEHSVTATVEAGVGRITLNRPERMNAITPRMDARLQAVHAELEARPDCHVIVIRGAGRGFCAGADLSEAGSARAPAHWAAQPGTRDRFRYAYLLQGAKPTIAAINGPAIGVGLVLALCCDLRIAADDAKLAFPYVRLGMAAEYGVAKLLPAMVGRAQAADLLLTGRTVLGAEAQPMGLVTRSAEGAKLDETVDEYADMFLRRCSPWSVGTVKRQLLEAQDQSLLEAIRSADLCMRQARQSADYQEVRLARQEGRQARFIKDVQ